MSCQIKSIEYCLPELVVTNEDLLKEHPCWDIEKSLAKTGVLARHIAAPHETALDLAARACEKLFQSGVRKENIDAVFFCTQSPDYILPSNAFLLHERLDFAEHIPVFDFNLACSGFIYGLAMAKAFIHTYQFKNVLFVTADTYSKYIHPQDKSLRFLFGDGAAATLIQPDEAGFFEVAMGSYGKGYSHFMIPAGGCRLPKSVSTRELITDNSGNVRTQEHISMEGFALLSLTRAKVGENIRGLLNKHHLSIEDIDVFIFHQASQIVLDSLIQALKIPKEKFLNKLSHVGNTVSSSIPIVFKMALEEGRIKPGDKILLAGFGAGFSWGSAIIKWQGNEGA